MFVVPKSRSARLCAIPDAERCGGWQFLKPIDSKEGGSNSVVESQPSKLLVAGPIPVSRSRI
jgi:hypothetical protein